MACGRVVPRPHCALFVPYFFNSITTFHSLRVGSWRFRVQVCRSQDRVRSVREAHSGCGPAPKGGSAERPAEARHSCLKRYKSASCGKSLLDFFNYQHYVEPHWTMNPDFVPGECMPIEELRISPLGPGLLALLRDRNCLSCCSSLRAHSQG